MWGATPVTERVAEIVTERIGVSWLAGYGASEVTVIAVNPVDRPEEWRLDSAGLPADRVSLRVVLMESCAEPAPGEIGGNPAQGPSVLAVYLPSESHADAFHSRWVGPSATRRHHRWGRVHLTPPPHAA